VTSDFTRRCMPSRFPSSVANNFWASIVMVLGPANAEPYLLWTSIHVSPSIPSPGSAFTNIAASMPPSPFPLLKNHVGRRLVNFVLVPQKFLGKPIAKLG
jgi:hypothetical protein